MRPRASRRRRAAEAGNGEAGAGDDPRNSLNLDDLSPGGDALGALVDGDPPEQSAAAAEKGEVDVITVQDVREWLYRIGFSEYEPSFVTNDINGAVLKTLTSEELRDDLNITNLRHRRDLGHAIQRLVEATTPVAVAPLPEHGRILDHLSNHTFMTEPSYSSGMYQTAASTLVTKVFETLFSSCVLYHLLTRFTFASLRLLYRAPDQIRTVHSWMRLGVQMLGFGVVTLRLSPSFRATSIVTAASFYFSMVGVVSLIYGIIRYKAVIKMIEQSGASTPKFNPDRSGVIVMLILILVSAGIALTLILLRGV